MKRISARRSSPRVERKKRVRVPLVSVVMPLYNNAKELRRAILSVLSQTTTQFELIVVNDGSTDGGERSAREFSDPRIHVIDQENKGVSSARNRGVRASRADLIAFLDADDEWNPDFLETILRLRKNFPACSVFATHYLYRELDGRIRSPILRDIPQGEWEGVLWDYFDVASRSDPPLWSSAVAVIKTALISVGGFPEGVTIGEDLLTWARLAARYKVAFSRKQCSVFWLRGSLTGFPTRIPEIPDTVGRELDALCSAVGADSRRSLQRYIALWHRMRASMFIQLNDGANAKLEVKKMAQYSPLDPRNNLFMLLAWTPRIMRKVVVQFFTFVKSIKRRIQST